MSGLSICQIVCEADCIQAMDSYKCPVDMRIIDSCDECLFRLRFDRDDSEWLPEGKERSDFPY